MLHMFSYITSEMNIVNHLYSDYDQEILRGVRKLEGLEHKLVKHRGAHIFKFQYLHEKSFLVAAK